MAQKQLSILVTAVDQATSHLKGIGASLAKVGTIASVAAVGVGGLMGVLATKFSFGQLNDAADQLDKIGDTAIKTGLAAKSLSELRYVAELSGGDFETLSAGLSTFNKNIGQFTSTGAGKAADAIKGLHIQLRNQDGTTREINDLLPDFIDKIGSMTDAYEQVNTAKKIFGDDSFLVWIRQGAEGFRQMVHEANALGVAFDEATVAVGANFKDGVDRVRNAFLGLRVSLLREVGPALTELMNNMAMGMAAVPKIIGKVVTTVKDAFGIGAAADDAKARLTEFGRASGEIIVRSWLGAWRVAAAYTPAALRSLSDVVLAWAGDMFDSLGTTIGNRTMAIVAGITGAFHNLPSITELLDMSPRDLDARMSSQYKSAHDMALTILTNIAAVESRSRRAIAASARDLEMLAHFGDSPEAAGVRRRVMGDIEEAAGAWTNALDGVTAYRDILNQVDFSGVLPRIARHTRDAAEATWQWSAAKDGLRRGWDEIVNRANDAAAWGKEAITSVTYSMTDGLSTAILDSISGVKSLGQAFKEFGAQTLRQIAEVITKMLVLRAISGIGNSLLGGVGAGGTPAAGSIVGTGRFAGSVAYANGGMVRPLGFDMGGVVPGPRVNRDIVPAMLTPGEGVVTRRGMAGLGAGGLDAINRGGGGGGVTVNVSVNMAGGGGGGGGSGGASLAQIKAAAAQGVLSALQSSPAMRMQMRRLVGA